MEALLAALEQSPFAASMRMSVFLYPVANVVHVLGALIFFAAVAAMDVRLLTAPSIDAARAFIGRVRPVAIAGFLVQLVTGVMLLAPEATHLWHNPVFAWKIGAIVFGLLNVIAVDVLVRRGWPAMKVPAAVAVGAVLSIGAWLGTATAGRLMAYF
jgi:hypothetical protein